MNRGRHRALLWVALGTFFLFSLLVGQFFKIQVAEGAKWTKVALNQHYFTIKEPFRRGAFFSNTGVKQGHLEAPQPFAFDIQKFHLHADSVMIPQRHKEEVADQVAAYLQLDRKEVLEELEKKSRNRQLARWLSQEQRNGLHDWWLSYAKSHRLARNALFFVGDYRRCYPFGKLLGPVLHTIQDRKEEASGQAIPTGGLELYFNEYLKGRAGSRRLMRSPRNALEMGELMELPEHGADVLLTINHILQAICEEEVEKAARKANAKAAWAVMMDPFTGEILALAQYPFFYPEHYQDYFNDPEKIWLTKTKALSDAYEPGSTLKPLNLALAVEASLEGGVPLDPHAKVAVSDGSFAGRSKPLKDVSHHRFLNFYQAIRKSSNIYVARALERVVAALGEEWYLNNLRRVFGLGAKTGIELPAESGGLVPTPGKRFSDGTPQWSGGALASIAMGYNLQVTSLQMVKAYSVLANGGYAVDPTLVQRVERPREQEREVIFDRRWKEESHRRLLSEEAVAQVVKGIKLAAKKGGSAARADIPGYTQAAKTGTSRKIVNGQYSQQSYFATCVGFAPASHPRFVLLVAVDEPEVAYIPGVGSPYYGGFCAAPVFREIAKRSLEYLGVRPDDPFGYPEGDPRRDETKTDWFEELQEQDALYREWNS